MAKRQSRTREARRRRQQQRRQNQRLLLLMAIVMVAVVAIAVVVVSNQPVEARIPEDISARYQDIPRSFSAEGYPRLGESDAPVNLAEYASFACPGCQALHSDSFDAILDRVRAGQLRFTYVPLQTGSVPNAEGASRAALCAGQQNMFWEMHDVLFDWQTHYGNTAFSQNRLLAGVEALELHSGDFNACFGSAATNNTLQAARNEDVTTTPTLRVNGVTLEAAGGIPSTQAILDAIDDATPADWDAPAEVPAVQEDEPAPTDAPEPTADATDVPSQADTAQPSDEPPATEASPVAEPASESSDDGPAATAKADADSGE